MRLSREDFEELKQFVLRNRWDWPAVFSCNYKGEVWPFQTYGYHDEADRVYVEGQNGLLDELVMTYLNVRPEGGRLFIDENGVFYSTQDDPDTLHKFISFEFSTVARSRTEPEVPPSWQSYYDRQQYRMRRQWRKS